ncbi:hypothetical protein EJB05_00011, partial [Eragrostis curvula]
RPPRHNETLSPSNPLARSEIDRGSGAAPRAAEREPGTTTGGATARAGGAAARAAERERRRQQGLSRVGLPPRVGVAPPPRVGFPPRAAASRLDFRPSLLVHLLGSSISGEHGSSTPAAARVPRRQRAHELGFHVCGCCCFHAGLSHLDFFQKKPTSTTKMSVSIRSHQEIINLTQHLQYPNGVLYVKLERLGSLHTAGTSYLALLGLIHPRPWVCCKDEESNRDVFVYKDDTPATSRCTSTS